MVKFSAFTLAAAIGLLTDVLPAQAVVLNGNFATGNFANWTTTGNTSVQDGNWGVTPPQTTYQAVLQTTTGTSVSGLETFLGLSSGTLNNLGATAGSAIRQTIAVNRGETLSFSWNFLTDEYPGSADYNDFAFFMLSNNVTTLANTFTPNNISFFSPLARETGYQSFTYAIAVSGTYTLGFGVVDVDNLGGGDTSINSALLVTNVATNTSAIPEPLTMMGSFAALGFIGVLNKKINKN